MPLPKDPPAEFHKVQITRVIAQVAGLRVGAEHLKGSADRITERVNGITGDAHDARDLITHASWKIDEAAGLLSALENNLMQYLPKLEGK